MFSSAAEADMSSTRVPGFLHPNPRNQNQTPNSKSDAEFLKAKDFQGPDFYHPPNQGGLARYRSAPSSFLAALMDSTTDNSSSGDESEAIFSAFMNQKSSNEGEGSHHQIQYQMKQEADPEARPGFSNGGMGYESAVSGGGGAIVGSYSLPMDTHVNANANGNGSTLMRQSSSPAGFFNGFGVMGEVGSYGVHNHQKSNSSGSGMSNHMSFSSGASSSSRFMPSIPENGNESIGARDSWNGSPFSTMKRNRDGEVKMFSSFGGALDNQNGDGRRNSSSGLVHHLSLPKNFAEAADTNKFLQFQQDTIPCQIRAKRGCATHPRSIAERMRRTRISERMKKLQDLFPNMDKQTNTADMLDLAVEYIKDLQKQVQTLTDTREKCVCSGNNKVQ